MAEIDKLLKQVRYIKGKVMNDPQTYSETHVSGGGGGGTGHHRSNVSISSRVDTWTTFLIETENGKEFMVKWPESLSVRKGHNVKVAVFREKCIAFINDKTDTNRFVTNIEGTIKWWSEAQVLSTPDAYGGLLIATFLAIPTFGLTLLAWVIFFGMKKKKLWKTGGNLAIKASDILETK